MGQKKGTPMKFRLLLLTMTFLNPGQLLAAEATLKPGQWETTVRMQMAGMPQLTPEQIAQMKQLGMEIPFLNEQPSVMQQCITAEQASLKKPLDPSASSDRQCTIQNYKKSGKTVSGDMVCSGELKARGRFEMTVESDTRYQGKWTLKGVTSEGQPVDHTTDISARWVKAKCDPGIVTAP